MRELILFFCFSFQPGGLTAQHTHAQIKKQSLKIHAFKQGINNYYEDRLGVTIKNSCGQVLQFSMDENNKIIAHHGSLAYVLYDFKDGLIKSITTYDKNGGKKADAEDLYDACVTAYKILNKKKLQKKLKALDASDGNSEMNDENEKLVLQQTFNLKKQLTQKSYISSKEFWGVQHLMFRL